MHSESWLEKADRLRSVLDELNAAPVLDEDEAAARESITIAIWLREEFSEEARQFGDSYETALTRLANVR